MSVDDTATLEFLAKVFGLALTVLLLVEAIRRVIIVPLLRTLHHLEELLVDWRGQEARPGFEEVPGVMKQLRTLTTAVQRAEYHLGNGNEPALRVLVMANSKAAKAAAEAAEEARLKAAEVGQNLHRHLESLADEARNQPDQKAGPS